MTTIAYISLLVTALIGLCAMLSWDLQKLQQNGYRNSQYNAWLRQSSELTSPKRLAVLAVLIASLTTMAQQSWIVVMILAAALLFIAIWILLKRDDKRPKPDGRAALLAAVTLTLAMLAIGGTVMMGKRLHEADLLRPASMTAVMVLAISPLLTMLANWLLGSPKKPVNDSNEKEKPKD